MDFTTHLSKAGKKIGESLQFPVSEPAEVVDGIPTDKTGGFVTLLGSQLSLQVAILSDTKGIQQISRALMCMEPDEPDLDEDDVADAMCEVANQLAGMMKRDLISACPDVRIGLPLVVKGSLLRPHGMQAETVKLRFGRTDVWLTAIVPKAGDDGGTAKVA